MKKNDMYDCEFWDDGKQISLNYEEQDDIGTVNEILRCLKALKELDSFIKPLGIEFWFRCSHKHYRYFNYSMELPQKVGYIDVSTPLLEVNFNHSVLSKAKVVSDVYPEVVIDFVEEFLQQRCPDPDFEPSWSSMNIWTTRVKIPNQFKLIDKDSIRLYLRWDVVKYPTLIHDSNLWVYGSKEKFPCNPPIKITINTEGGAHTITLYICWSIWYDRELPGYKELYEAIQRIIAQGWQLSEYTPMEEPKYAA